MNSNLSINQSLIAKTDTELVINQLFKPFTEIQLNGTTVDLHNDFDCVKIKHNEYEKTLVVEFTGSNRFSEKVSLAFSEVELIQANFSFDNIQTTITLDNFYRGRFLNSQNELAEQNNEGKNCYYLDFCEGQACEFLAQNVYLSIENISS